MYEKFSQIVRFKKQGGSFIYFLKRKMINVVPRQLLNETPARYWSHSARRINNLMAGRDFRYLEVGVAYGTTLQAINASSKVGVDPNPLFDLHRLPRDVTMYVEDSDQFFKSLEPQVKYDFVFLDGLHESRQLLRDIINSLKHLDLRGWLLIDDVIPSDSISAIPDLEISYSTRGVRADQGFPWHGDCFRILPWIFQLDFLDSYLIIYPDNPQLLVRVRDSDACKRFLDTFSIENFEYSRLEYQDFFSSENLSQMPLYIEELLIKELLLD
jgi:Methyltransferase domain